MKKFVPFNSNKHPIGTTVRTEYGLYGVFLGTAFKEGHLRDHVFVVDGMLELRNMCGQAPGRVSFVVEEEIPDPPAPKVVPLDRNDISITKDCFRRKGFAIVQSIEAIGDEGLWFNISPPVCWAELATDYEISHDDGKTWNPMTKEG